MLERLIIKRFIAVQTAIVIGFKTGLEVFWTSFESFKAGIEAVFGEGMCHILSIRSVGGIEIKL